MTMFLSLQPKCAEYFPNTDGGDIMRVYGQCEVIQERREVRPEWIMSVLTLKHLQVTTQGTRPCFETLFKKHSNRIISYYDAYKNR